MSQQQAGILDGSAEHHRLLIESWAQAVWEADADGRVSKDSPSWRAYTGQTLEEWLGDGWLDAIHPDDRDHAWQQWRDAVTARRFLDAEFRLRAPGGSWRWTNVRAAPVLDADGHLGKWVGMNIDIDERKRGEIEVLRLRDELAQAQVRESEELLWQFGEASQDVLWIRDAETMQWQYLTPAFKTIYGLRRNEVLAGDNYNNWLDLIVPEDRVHANEMIGRVRAGECVSFEYRIKRPVDGQIRWLRNSDFPIRDRDGKVVLIGGIGHDLTVLRATQSHLEAVLENIPQLVWRANEPGRWTWSSSQWVKYTGQDDAASGDWGWLEPIHPEDRDVARAAWERAGEDGIFSAEYRIREHATGCYRWFQTRATPLRDESGATIEWFGTSTDVDDLRRLQDRQQLLVEELQHRTFNLMGMVQSTADMTIRSSVDLAAFRVKFRDRIDALARVQRLLSRLPVDERVSFGTLIRAELDATGALNEVEQRVTLEGPDEVPLRSRIVQTFAMALHELTTNAVKYGALKQPDAHLSVRWWVDADAQGQRLLHVDWRETGVVMPPPGAAPQGTGHGRLLIEKAMPFQLSAHTTYVMEEDGVRCMMSLPI